MMFLTLMCILFAPTFSKHHAEGMRLDPIDSNKTKVINLVDPWFPKPEPRMDASTETGFPPIIYNRKSQVGNPAIYMEKVIMNSTRLPSNGDPEPRLKTKPDNNTWFPSTVNSSDVSKETTSFNNSLPDRPKKHWLPIPIYDDPIPIPIPIDDGPIFLAESSKRFTRNKISVRGNPSFNVNDDYVDISKDRPLVIPAGSSLPNLFALNARMSRAVDADASDVNEDISKNKPLPIPAGSSQPNLFNIFESKGKAPSNGGNSNGIPNLFALEVSTSKVGNPKNDAPDDYIDITKNQPLAIPAGSSFPNLFALRTKLSRAVVPNANADDDYLDITKNQPLAIPAGSSFPNLFALDANFSETGSPDTDIGNDYVDMSKNHPMSIPVGSSIPNLFELLATKDKAAKAGSSNTTNATKKTENPSKKWLMMAGPRSFGLSITNQSVENTHHQVPPILDGHVPSQLQENKSGGNSTAPGQPSAISPSILYPDLFAYSDDDFTISNQRLKIAGLFEFDADEFTVIKGVGKHHNKTIITSTIATTVSTASNLTTKTSNLDSPMASTESAITTTTTTTAFSSTSTTTQGVTTTATTDDPFLTTATTAADVVISTTQMNIMTSTTADILHSTSETANETSTSRALAETSTSTAAAATSSMTATASTTSSSGEPTSSSAAAMFHNDSRPGHPKHRPHFGHHHQVRVPRQATDPTNASDGYQNQTNTDQLLPEISGKVIIFVPPPEDPNNPSNDPNNPPEDPIRPPRVPNSNYDW